MKKQDYEDNSDKMGEIIREKLESLDYSYQESSWEKLNHQLGTHSSTYFTHFSGKDIFWGSITSILLIVSVYFAYENYQLKNSKEQFSFLKKYQQDKEYSRVESQDLKIKTQDASQNLNPQSQNISDLNPLTHKTSTPPQFKYISSITPIPLLDKPIHLHQNSLFDDTRLVIKQKRKAPSMVVPKSIYYQHSLVAVKAETKKSQKKKQPKIYWSTGIIGGVEIDKINLAEGLFAHSNIGITQELDFANSPIRLSFSALYTRKHYKFNQISSPPTDNLANTITENIQSTNFTQRMQAPNDFLTIQETTNDGGDLLVNEVHSDIFEFPVEIKYFINPKLFIGTGWSSYLFTNQQFGFDPNIGEGFKVDTEKAKNKTLYSGILMFSGGFETTLSRNLQLQMQAYYKYPLVSVGLEKANIQSFGIRSSLLFRWNR